MSGPLGSHSPSAGTWRYIWVILAITIPVWVSFFDLVALMRAAIYARIPLLALLCLLVLAMSAHAECSWVLWALAPSVPVTAPKKEWNAVNAFQSFAECTRAAPKDTMIDYLCLPDTIDPRGRK